MSAAPFPTLVQIKSPHQAHRTLTLQGAPNNLPRATAPKIRRVVTYKTQPDYLVPPDAQLGSGTYQVYVDVWERQITYVEDDSIREVALGGPDTAARAKVVWQVELTGPVDARRCLTPRQLRDRLQRDAAGRLKAMARQGSTSTDPCIVPLTRAIAEPKTSSTVWRFIGPVRGGMAPTAARRAPPRSNGLARTGP